MDKQYLMDWLNYTDEILDERFADIREYIEIYPTIIENILGQQMKFQNVMDEAYKKLEKM